MKRMLRVLLFAACGPNQETPAPEVPGGLTGLGNALLKLPR